MNVIICSDKNELGCCAAKKGAEILREAIAEQGYATIIVATGASQFEMLEALVEQPGIDWSRITAFHLDAYIGVTMAHKASFRRYLKERFVEHVPIKVFQYINGEGYDGNGDMQAECARLNKLIDSHSIDVAFVGIGENGHLAFNDPPADFETDEPYIVVDLDKNCRLQQLNEGWFDSLEDVPRQAISMSVRQIMKSKHIICSVPDSRKAESVRNSIAGPVTNEVPASIIQQHESATIFLDKHSAALLQGNKLSGPIGRKGMHSKKPMVPN